MNKITKITFEKLPESVEDIKNIDRTNPQLVAATVIAAFCNFEKNPDAVFEMVDFLNGPSDVSNYDRNFLRERLKGKYYKPFSFFEGSSPENDYKPTLPYTISIIEGPYAHQDEGYIGFYVKSSGADSPRPIKVRLKPSTGEWFLWGEIMLFSDIRIPKSEDPWA